MSEIVMPKLSDSMEDGTILKWLKADGQSVTAGDELVEIETDKATMTYESEADGVLEIVAQEGQTVTVGTVIAHVGARRQAVGTNGTAAARGPEVTPIAEVQATPRAAPIGRATPIGPATPIGRATPIARRFAREHGIELGNLVGSGPGGRITRADVASKAGPAVGPGDSRLVELSRLQRTVARRMAEATASVPHFQVQTEVAMDEAIALRARLKALAHDGAAPSLNDFVIKACALALRRHPGANGSYVDAGFELHDQINVGFAVASDEALVVPTVIDADAKSLGQIAADTRRLAARVRAGEVSPAELGSGTFTVSNLGMFGMTAITPVINPPEAAILGVGALREVLARVDGEILDRTLMTLTLSCDHRILYGADAARFLAEIKALLEAPLTMAL